MTSTTEALDALHHPDLQPKIPAIGSHADRLTCAAAALQAIMRVAPPALAVADVTIRPTDGKLTIHAVDHDPAQALAARLGLPAALHVTELDHGWLCKRWTGRWADWPVTVQHLYRPTEDAR